MVQRAATLRNVTQLGAAGCNVVLLVKQRWRCSLAAWDDDKRRSSELLDLIDLMITSMMEVALGVSCPVTV